MIPDADLDDAQELALIADLDRMAGAACIACGRPLCGHIVLFSVALGFRNAPRCRSCLAAGLRRSAAELAGQLVDYIQRKDCYRRAWDIASDREGVPRSPTPTCIGGSELSVDSADIENSPSATALPATEWDAGDLACGDLVMELRSRLRRLPPGTAIRVTASDPAAPLDLPAWCRLTGNHLLLAEHPVYVIRRSR